MAEEEPASSNKKRQLPLIVRDALWWGPGLAVAYGVRWFIQHVDWALIWNLFKTSWAQFIALAAVLIASVGLFRLRSRRPKIYAGLEAIVGFTSAWLAFSPDSGASPTERGAKALAAVYLLIRSGDNWNRAMTPKKTGDKRARAIAIG
jgi:hypothetical protein